MTVISEHLTSPVRPGVAIVQCCRIVYAQVLLFDIHYLCASIATCSDNINNCDDFGGDAYLSLLLHNIMHYFRTSLIVV